MLRLTLAVLAWGFLGGCRTAAPPLESPRSGQLHVLIIDGGRDPRANYRSHLLHVRMLAETLAGVGVDRQRIAIFASDGSDPALDLALRELQPEPAFWLVGETRLGPLLQTPIVYENSTVAGHTLQPATRDALGRWFSSDARRLRPGDTLLVYVTDHGTKAAEPDDNKITLWGADEALAVRQLRELLGTLDPGVRVVLLMSQCYSGAFARAGADPAGPPGVWRPNVCGYFSSTADRPAYGCYPENRGRDNVGHSFHFLRALDASRSLPQSHAAVVEADATPDVPLRSSDVYLEDLLRRVATFEGREWTSVADEQLRAAWEDRGSWEPQIRLLDRTAHTYGMFSPRSLAELDDLARRLPEVGGEYRGFGQAWHGGLRDSSSANLTRFVTAHPTWTPRLADESLRGASEQQRRDVTQELFAGLLPFTRHDRVVFDRLHQLHRNAELADEVAYRMEVRLGVALRMRAVLVEVSGRTYLARRGTADERARYDALIRCEDLTLGAPQRGEEIAIEARPFPSYDDDLASARRVQPAWMGIQFKEASPEQQKGFGLGDGAAFVVAVYPESPAATAGLKAGDFVLGPPTAPFREKNQVRTWTMFSRPEVPQRLAILRNGERSQLTLIPKPFPRKWPDLPGPVKVGEAAPRLDLPGYRGGVAATLAAGSPRLLFFWATWCGPCKASLPELLAFERERRMPVVAITDESRAQLDTFFAKFDQPFPALVALDEARRSFVAYGVGGTPTFVVIDAAGVVTATWTGYRRDEGLHIPGWRWSEGAAH